MKSVIISIRPKWCEKIANCSNFKCEVTTAPQSWQYVEER